MVRPVQLEDQEFTGLRGKIAAFVERPSFSNIIALIIVINAITLGLETDTGIVERFGSYLNIFETIVLGIFSLEILLKLYCYRLHFFRSGWNNFDFVIVVFSLLPATGPFSILRALRIFRILRLMSVIPSLRRVITGLLQSIPGMASVVGMLLLIFYVSAVLCTKLFGQGDDPQMQELFGTVPASMYSLFQVMTLEGWSDNVVNPALEVYPWSWIFFIPFIIITAFAVLNLFIGIIVDGMQHEDKMTSTDDIDEAAARAQQDAQEIKAEIKALRADIEKLARYQ